MRQIEQLTKVTESLKLILFYSTAGVSQVKTEWEGDRISSLGRFFVLRTDHLVKIVLQIKHQISTEIITISVSHLVINLAII